MRPKLRPEHDVGPDAMRSGPTFWLVSQCGGYEIRSREGLPQPVFQMFVRPFGDGRQRPALLLSASTGTLWTPTNEAEYNPNCNPVAGSVLDRHVRWGGGDGYTVMRF